MIITDFITSIQTILTILQLKLTVDGVTRIQIIGFQNWIGVCKYRKRVFVFDLETG